MILVNSEELKKHQIVVHIDKMFQCQSCNKVFDNKQEFERHAIEVHSSNTLLMMLLIKLVKTSRNTSSSTTNR
jgi:hypothetical protein